MSVQSAKKDFDSYGLHHVSCVDHYIHHYDTSAVQRSCASALGLHIFSSLLMSIVYSALEPQYSFCQTSSVQCSYQLGSSSFQVPKIRYHVAWEDLCQTEHIDHVIRPEEQGEIFTSKFQSLAQMSLITLLSFTGCSSGTMLCQSSFSRLQNEFVKPLANLRIGKVCRSG